jgi:glycosyltransferase involved in cell wall biosynthesis
MKKIKSRIMLHIISPNSLNGPNSVWQCIKDSTLKDSYEFLDLVQTDFPGKNPLRILKLILKMKKQIDEAQVDIVHVTGLQFAGFCATLAAKISKASYIVVGVHGFSGDALSITRIEKFLYSYIIEPLTIKMATKVYTVCEFASRNPVITRNAKTNFFGVIHNPAPRINFDNYDASIFRAEMEVKKDDILVVVVGRVVYDKGHSYIIEAIRKVTDDRIRFVIAGDGDYLINYTEQLSEYINNGKVILLGGRSDIPSILKGCDIFLFASLHENLSMALLEASMMRCPIISTNVDGNPEIIKNNMNGLLIPPHDSQSIAEAVLLLSQDAKQRRRLSDEALKVTESKFSQINTIYKIDYLYRSILDEEN